MGISGTSVTENNHIGCWRCLPMGGKSSEPWADGTRWQGAYTLAPAALG